MLTGRKAIIVSISMAPRPIEQVLPILEREAAGKGDLLLLPETCLGNMPIETIDGDAVRRVSVIAAKYKKYIVFPIYRCSGDIQRINSAILLDRAGSIAGIYDKVFPYWSEFDLEPPAAPGENAPVFETDFGKIGLTICFDVNFPELWKCLSKKGAELVLWPSAYSAGTSLQAHAINHNYIIITSTMIPDCVVYDIDGREVFYGRGEDVAVFRTEVDLDRCIFHTNFNTEPCEKLLSDHGDVVRDTFLEREQWFTLRAIKPGVSARALAREYGLEELSAYKLRSKVEIDKIRGHKGGKV